MNFTECFLNLCDRLKFNSIFHYIHYSIVGSSSEYISQATSSSANKPIFKAKPKTMLSEKTAIQKENETPNNMDNSLNKTGQ